LIERLINNTFSEEHQPTLQPSFREAEFDLEEKINLVVPFLVLRTNSTERVFSEVLFRSGMAAKSKIQS